MHNENIIKIVLEKTTDEFQRIFGDSLKSVILYGSYARGDYNEESDIDVVALVSQQRSIVQKSIGQIAEFSSDMGLEHDIILSPAVIPYEEFIKYKNDLPYYTNIAEEGVVLFG